MILLQASINVLFITAAILLVAGCISAGLVFLFQKRKIAMLQQRMNALAKALDDHISQLTLVKINMNLLAGNGLDAANEQKLEDTKNKIKEVISDIRVLGKTLKDGLNR